MDYNTYNLNYTVNEGKLVNKLAQISAPYNFSGNIRYYLIDGAGNRSDEYSFNVKYHLLHLDI